MDSRESELKLIYLLFDLFILNFSIIFIACLRFGLQADQLNAIGNYFLQGNLAWMITYFAFSKRNLYLRDGYFNRVKRIAKRTVFFLLITSVLGFLMMPKFYSRSFLLEYTATFLVCKLIFYYFLYLYLQYKRKMGLNTQRVLIVGYNKTTQLLQQIVDGNPLMGYKFCGFLTRKAPKSDDIIGRPDELAMLVEAMNIQLVFIAVSFTSSENNTKEYLDICNRMGIRVRFIPDNQRWFKSRMNMESVGSLAVFNPQEIPLDDIAARISKRAFDILFSSLTIVFLLSWLLPIMAIIIKLNSKGPVFFVQNRTGMNNRDFPCIKFRSMAPNKNADQMQATKNDNRVTSVGRFMRKTNIDELPQFFNVLWGQMSVVGPRPHMLKHTKEYSALIDTYMTRHYVKPGITGWAQVNGYRGETDELWKMEKRVAYDREYMENWSLWWDVVIIWQTVFSPKSRENAF
ncbi:undecaprenyl-phosphate glucose phosphotransferase [Mangrovibacterium marinum]|uniref:undecaprenyl-phosphate glucose phosphotransferase n=1 Tax=Mangrovibacterium marinum TaxID=1639118 RepID=UPI002A1890BC|nr:undecaprenyl-phosphate glucose phosphotransferase [Mangrovibacterium marinum]